MIDAAVAIEIGRGAERSPRRDDDIELVEQQAETDGADEEAGGGGEAIGRAHVRIGYIGNRRRRPRH